MLLDKLLSKTIDKNIVKYIIIFSLILILFIFNKTLLSVENLIKLSFLALFVLFFIYKDYQKEIIKSDKLNDFGKDFNLNEILNNTDILIFLEDKKYIKNINNNTYFDIIKHCTYFYKSYKLSEIDKGNAKMYYDCANDEKNEIINLMSSLSISKTKYDHYSKKPDYEIIENDINQLKEILNNYLRKIGLITIDEWENEINYTKAPFYNQKVQPRDKYNYLTNII